MRQIVNHLTILHRLDGRVICTGVFKTHDGAGTHSSVTPCLLDGEIEFTEPMKVGYTILRYDDGTHEHKPKP